MDNMISSFRAARTTSPLLYSLPFLLALGLVYALYHLSFVWWWHEWMAPGSFYAHAIFVPVFVVVMLWRNRDRFAEAVWKPAWGGLAILIPTLILSLLAQRGEIAAVQSLTFIGILFGFTLLLLGTAKTKVLLFPLLFIVMMMPLVPDQLINGIAFPIQLASAKMATAMLNILQLPSSQEGTRIQMEHYRMAVELPCSGFKTLLSLLTFSAAFAYLVEAPNWKRWTLFLTTAPLSLVINALRIAFIGIVGELVGRDTAAIFHDYSGFIVLIMAFTFLFNFARILRCRRFLGLPLNEAEDKKDRAKAEAKVDNRSAWWQEMLQWRPTVTQWRKAMPYILVLDLTLGGAVAVRALMTRKLVPDLPIATYQVPQEFVSEGVTFRAKESAVQDKLPKDIQENLNPIRIINRDYIGSDGSRIGLFITAGSGRKVFHDPHTCSLGSNATLQDVGTIDVPTSHGTVRVLETHFKANGLPAEYELMFCYVVESDVVQRTETVRNRIMSQMIFGDSGKPSYFFRVTHTDPGTDEAHKKQMTRFIAGMWDKIGPILTGKVKGLPDAAPTPVKETTDSH